MPKISNVTEQPELQTREIIYPIIEVQKGTGLNALDVETCKSLLGWSNSPLPERPDEPHMFVDMHGEKVWCHNNVNADYTNRPLTWPNVLALKQEHLRKKWRFNGETVIIGQTGLVLNGQHQMIALVLAAQEWSLYPEDWDTWSEEPTMEKLVVFGVPEDDATVNTMDTCKPRTLSEVIFRSSLFQAMPNKDRKTCAKICEHAVRLLWHRTGVSLDAFAPRRTHSEALDFITRHPKLLSCVKHIFEENDKGLISAILSPGYSAALMYLMGSCNTSPEKYHNADIAHEVLLNWDNFSKAEDFFSLIAGSTKLQALNKSITELAIQSRDNRDSRIAVLLKGWLVFVQDKPVTLSHLKLDFNEEGKLCECPTAGGVDRGNPKDDMTEDEPTEQEKAEHKAAEQAVKQEKRKGKSKKSSYPEVGDSVWVTEEEGNWDGELVEVYQAQGKPVGKVKSHGTGKIFEAPLERISLTEPD